MTHQHAPKPGERDPERARGRPAQRSSVGAHQLLALQRAAGNRAVGDVVQRQVRDPAPEVASGPIATGGIGAATASTAGATTAAQQGIKVARDLLEAFSGTGTRVPAPNETETEPGPGSVKHGPGTPTPAPPSGARPVLRWGSTGDPVKTLQMKLGGRRHRQHDRPEGSVTPRIDGIFGPKTHQDVIDFQRSFGLGVDGIVGAQTWHALDSVAPAEPDEGAVREDYAQVEAGLALFDAGQYAAALVHFEAILADPAVANHDWVAGAAVMAGSCHHHLGHFAAAVSLYERALASQFFSRATKGDVLQSLEKARQNILPDAEAPSVEVAEGEEGGGLTERPDLTVGSAGPQVEILQVKLWALQTPSAGKQTDGTFNEVTAARLRIFQTAVGLEPSGVADRSTWHALDTHCPVDGSAAQRDAIVAGFKAGQALLNAGLGAAALVHFESARAASWCLETQLIMDAQIAKAHHLMGNFAEAIPLYESYLTDFRLDFAGQSGMRGLAVRELRRARNGQPPTGA